MCYTPFPAPSAKFWGKGGGADQVDAVKTLLPSGIGTINGVKQVHPYYFYWHLFLNYIPRVKIV